MVIPSNLRNMTASTTLYYIIYFFDQHLILTFRLKILNFFQKHDSSQHILCLYCLKVFVVKFVSQGWGQTQTYYGHLLKHQSKSGSKKCNSCRLTFVNPADCKNHKKKDHVANQKGIGTNKIIQFTVPFSQLYFKVAQHTKILFDGLIKNYLLELDFMQPCQRKIYI